MRFRDVRTFLLPVCIRYELDKKKKQSYVPVYGTQKKTELCTGIYGTQKKLPWRESNHCQKYSTLSVKAISLYHTGIWDSKKGCHGRDRTTDQKKSMYYELTCLPTESVGSLC